MNRAATIRSPGSNVSGIVDSTAGIAGRSVVTKDRQAILGGVRHDDFSAVIAQHVADGQPVFAVERNRGGMVEFVGQRVAAPPMRGIHQ